MSEWMYGVALIATASIVTIFTRAIPFVLFRQQQLPSLISYLGNLLPSSIMVILIIYCLKDTFGSFSLQGSAAYISLGVLLLLHRWRHNVLLSIGCTTILYMILIRLLPFI